MINLIWIKEHLFAIVSKLPSTLQCVVLSMKYPDFRSFEEFLTIFLWVFQNRLSLCNGTEILKKIIDYIEVNKCTPLFVGIVK